MAALVCLMLFIFVVIVRSFENWANREQFGSRQSWSVRRSPGSDVVGLQGEIQGIALEGKIRDL